MFNPTTTTNGSSTRSGNHSRSSNGSYNSQNSTADSHQFQQHLGASTNNATAATQYYNNNNKKEPSVSGYAADIDRLVKKINRSPLPATIDFLTRSSNANNKNKYSDSSDHGYGTTMTSSSNYNNQAASKRFKTHELSYQAHMAKTDLLRAGLRVPTVRVSCPRTLPSMSGVDMSGVTLMHSKDFDAALVNKNDYLSKSLLCNSNSNSSSSEEIRTKWVIDLAIACRYAYSLPDVVESCESKKLTAAHAAAIDAANAETDTASSTSSVTDPDSGNEDANTVALMSMGEALMLHSQPRLVCLSFAPYTIVHMNAAFSRLTGLSSANVMGQSFLDVMNCNSDYGWAKQLLSKNNLDSLKSLHNQVIEYSSFVSNNNNNSVVLKRTKKCKVTVASVGVNVENVSHFVLDFSDRHGNPFIFSNNNEAQAAENNNNATIHGVAIKQIG